MQHLQSEAITASIREKLFNVLDALNDLLHICSVSYTIALLVQKLLHVMRRGSKSSNELLV